MSNKKLDSKMLKNLIKEVLEEQRLDEKNVKLSRLKSGDISTAKKYWPEGEWAMDQFTPADFKKDGKIDNASVNDGDGKDLSPLDVATDKFNTKDDSFYDRVGNADRTEEFFDEMDAEFKKLQGKRSSKEKSKRSSKDKSKKTSKDKSKKTSKDKSKKTSKDKSKKTSTPLAKKLAKKSIPTAATPGKVNPFGQFPKAYTPDVSSKANRGREWKKWGDIKKSLKADPLLDNMFNSIDGDTAVAKWTNIMEFADKAMRGKEELNDWYKETAGGNEFKLVNYSFVLSLLADTPKVTDSTNAGNFFEGFLFYLLGAPILGKGGKAIDNATKLDDKSILYMSAKFYLSLGQVKQSYDNLIDDTKDFKTIYYMTLIKSSQNNPQASVSGGEFDQLSLHYTAVSKGSKGKIKAQAIDAEGKLVGKTWTIDNDGKLFPSGSNKTAALEIPVLKVKGGKRTESQLAEFTASYLSEVIQKTSAKKAAGITKVLEELTTMDQKVKQYSGEKSLSKPDAKKTSNYMKSIYSSYVSATKSYKEIFKSETGEQFSKVSAPEPVKESKKITANFLKKLFKETLKK